MPSNNFIKLIQNIALGLNQDNLNDDDSTNDNLPSQLNLSSLSKIIDELSNLKIGINLLVFNMHGLDPRISQILNFQLAYILNQLTNASNINVNNFASKPSQTSKTFSNIMQELLEIHNQLIHILKVIPEFNDNVSAAKILAPIRILHRQISAISLYQQTGNYDYIYSAFKFPNNRFAATNIQNQMANQNNDLTHKKYLVEEILKHHGFMINNKLDKSLRFTPYPTQREINNTREREIPNGVTQNKINPKGFTTIFIGQIPNNRSVAELVLILEKIAGQKFVKDYSENVINIRHPNAAICGFITIPTNLVEVITGFYNQALRTDKNGIYYPIDNRGRKIIEKISEEIRNNGDLINIYGLDENYFEHFINNCLVLEEKKSSSRYNERSENTRNSNAADFQTVTTYYNSNHINTPEGLNRSQSTYNSNSSTQNNFYHLSWKK